MKRFSLDDVPKLKSRYNIAPTQKIPVILNTEPKKVSMVR